ncbi:MAG: helix-turn-helix domain-containing protein [Chloroflexi bacterium]|nr:helix-turn-helix domain-containing protein [Chloroflexota bacterium]
MVEILLDYDGGDDLHVLSLADVAAMAGTAVEVASRELHKMEGMGLVRLHRGRIVIADPRGLRKLI